jgi:peroxiredoxin
MSLDGEQAPAFELESTDGGTTGLAESLERGPAVVLINRGHWCSFCAEQLSTFDEVSYDLWFNDGVDVLPVLTSEVPELVAMRDRFDYGFQLLADPDGAVAEQYSGTEQTSHGTTGVAGTYVIDTEGVVRYEQVADHPADRTYGNWVRYFIRNDYENAFA